MRIEPPECYPALRIRDQNHERDYDAIRTTIVSIARSEPRMWLTHNQNRKYDYRIKTANVTAPQSKPPICQSPEVISHWVAQSQSQRGGRSFVPLYSLKAGGRLREARPLGVALVAATAAAACTAAAILLIVRIAVVVDKALQFKYVMF